MTADDVLKQLRPLASDSYKRILLRHGVREPVLGVKVEDLKKVQKKVKKDHRLAMDLYDTGVYDAQYLAGLIADETKMSRKDLRHWLARANSPVLCGYTVAWVTAETPHGRELALEWIASNDESTAEAGWATLSSLVSITDDDDLDLKELDRLMARVEKSIHQQPDHVRYAMNNFVIAVGCYVPALTKRAAAAADKVGEVSVDMGETACKVPFAPDYIRKARQRGTIGKKRKSARC